MKIYNSQPLKNRRRELRKNQTPTEKIVWELIRGRRLGNYRFVRQYSVGTYILDFYCPSVRLALEIDGQSHTQENNRIYDQERKNYLEGFGITIIRFWNSEVLKDPQVIRARLHPLLSIREGRGELA